jgi:hypothetical protein
MLLIAYCPDDIETTNVFCQNPGRRVVRFVVISTVALNHFGGAANMSLPRSQTLIIMQLSESVERLKGVDIEHAQ